MMRHHVQHGIWAAGTATIFFALTGFASAVEPAGGSTVPLSPDSKPNMVFILADDLGWADVGYHGSPIPTPNIDRFAREGVVLAWHYAAPVCSPARAGLLTGRYWSRFGITVPNSSQCLPDHTPTIASRLKEAGYRTALIWKWHLGGAKLTNKRPALFGFDKTYGCLDGGANALTHLYSDHGKGEFQTWHRDGVFIEEKGHVTDLLAVEAIRFIESSQKSPFFLYLPFTAPHEKYLDTPEWIAKCAHLPKERQEYAAMVAHMDDAMGKVVGTLDRLGLRKNTLIVFCSDNGGTRKGLNNPLRQTKGYVYEGGVHVVAFANWPGRLQPSTLAQPCCITDWMPTFCALAGVTPPANVDGQDLWPALTHPDAPATPRPIYLLGMHGKSSALILGDWKLVHIDGHTELYNLGQDPAEAKDLAAAFPERVRELEQRLTEAARADKDAVAPEMRSAKP